jgi:hypothetical protein
MRPALSYLRRRLCERSTLGDLAAAATAAAIVPWPWSLAAMALLTAKALVPDGRVFGAPK